MAEICWHVSNNDRTLQHRNGKGIVTTVPLPLAGKFFIHVRTSPIFVNMVPSNHRFN